MDYRVSFLIFFGSLIGMTALLLRKSLVSADHGTERTIYTLHEWYTPNLRKWKNYCQNIWSWIHDVSLRKWLYLLTKYTKHALYTCLKKLHMILISLIKLLERHEEGLKDKMRERGNLATPQHSEKRLMSVLSKKRFLSPPIEIPADPKKEQLSTDSITR
jgi:hypothetical protein